MAVMRSFELLSQVRTCFRMDGGRGRQGGLCSGSRVDERSCAVGGSFKMKAVTFVLLLLALSAAGVGAQEKLWDGAAKQTPDVAPDPVEARSVSHRPADEMVNEIEAQLKIARRPLPGDEFLRTHNRIATLVDELRRVYPSDHRVAKFLPERWWSFTPDIGERLATGYMCPKCSCEHAGRKLGELIEEKPQPPKKRYAKGRGGWPVPTKWELRYLMELEAWHVVRWQWLSVLMVSAEGPIKYKTKN